MIFEHRLRQNVAVLQTTWVRYQLTLILLTCVALYGGYSLLGDVDMNLLSYSTHVAIFLLALVGLGTLLGSGLYAERVAQARAFVPRCQRALANFCLGFQPDNGGHLTILARRRLPAKFVTDFHQYRDAIRMRAAGLQTGPLHSAADKTSTANE